MLGSKNGAADLESLQPAITATAATAPTHTGLHTPIITIVVVGRRRRHSSSGRSGILAPNRRRLSYTVA